MSEKHKIRTRRSKHRPAWVKLDNTAILFPAIASREMSNVYRIAVTLKEDIDGELLQMPGGETVCVRTGYGPSSVFGFSHESKDRYLLVLS